MRLKYHDMSLETRAGHRTYSSLVIYTEGDDPRTVTNLLHVEPDDLSYASIKGESSVIGKRQRLNAWSLTTKDVLSSGDAGEHINHLFDLLNDAENIQENWRIVLERNWRVQLWVFWSSDSGNGGPCFQPDVIARLNNWGVSLVIDCWLTIV